MLDNHYVPEGFGLITNFTFFNIKISTYSFFISLALIVGTLWFYLTIKKTDKKNNAYIIVISALIRRINWFENSGNI